MYQGHSDISLDVIILSKLKVADGLSLEPTIKIKKIFFFRFKV